MPLHAGETRGGESHCIFALSPPSDVNRNGYLHPTLYATPRMLPGLIGILLMCLCGPSNKSAICMKCSTCLMFMLLLVRPPPTPTPQYPPHYLPTTPITLAVSATINDER